MDEEVSRLNSTIRKLEWKVEQQEKEIKSERQKKDKIILTFADQLGRYNKLPDKFVKSVEEKEPEPQFIHPEREKFEHYAREMRDNDIATMGIENVRPLEDYVERIEADPEQVFIG